MKIQITRTPDYCAASYYKESGVKATAEASNLGDVWYVNRVLVLPPKYRGKGIGGTLLEALKKAVRSVGGKVLVVTPGGYGAKPEDQVNFYKQHGFVEDSKEKGLLILRL